MHKALPALASAFTLAVPTAGVWAQTAVATTAAKKKVVTRKVVGTSAQAGRWGYVQVTLVVRKTTTIGTKTKVTRRIVGATATAPDHTNRSIFINQQAIPWLTQEVLQAQLNPNINLISGATDTSYAFVDSLQAAILKAKAL